MSFKTRKLSNIEVYKSEMATVIGMVAVLITELSFLVGARLFFLVEERGGNGDFSTVFL